MTFYELLGVDRNASDEIIKAAYRVQAKKYHPDLTANDPRSQQQMQRINEAYAVLSDRVKRNTYDLTLREPEPPVRNTYDHEFNTEQYDDYTDYDEPPRQKNRSGGRGIIVALILLAILLTAGLFYLFYAILRYSLFG